MFGLEDKAIAAAYSLSIFCTIGCVLYGIFNWNRGAEKESQQIDEEAKWAAEEQKIDDSL